MISIIIPTNKPPEFAKRTIESILAQGQVISNCYVNPEYIPYQAVIVTDNPNLDGVCSYCEVTNGTTNIVHVIQYPSKGAINGWNYGLRCSMNADYFIIGSDDIIFHLNSLAYGIEAHKIKLGGYGVVGLNDLHNDGDNHTTHFLFDRKFCIDHLGRVMAYPVYNFFCNDNEILERAKLANAYYYCKDAIVEHLHPSNGKRPIVGDEANRSEAMEHDIKLFYERKAQGFPNNFEPVLK